MMQAQVNARPRGCRPHVNWKHIDGPLMTRRDGTLKWLTWRERLMLWIGAWSIEQVERRPYRF